MANILKLICIICSVSFIHNQISVLSPASVVEKLSKVDGGSKSNK